MGELEAQLRSLTHQRANRLVQPPEASLKAQALLAQLQAVGLDLRNNAARVLVSCTSSQHCSRAAGGGAGGGAGCVGEGGRADESGECLECLGLLGVRLCRPRS